MSAKGKANCSNGPYNLDQNEMIFHIGVRMANVWASPRTQIICYCWNPNGKKYPKITQRYPNKGKLVFKLYLFKTCIQIQVLNTAAKITQCEYDEQKLYLKLDLLLLSFSIIVEWYYFFFTYK